MANAWVELSSELADAAAAIGRRVVSVRARRRYPASGLRLRGGVVVTADHALQREEEITVTLPEGETVAAMLVGRDQGSDLAVLQVEAAPPPEPLRPAGPVRAGELALVVGRSPDSGVNASLGIVSAVSGPWRTWSGGQLDAYLRLDARLFPQSAGGAVVNARGEVIGLATPALSRIAALAIPMATVERVAAQLLDKGFVPRGYVGIGAQAAPLSAELQRRLGLNQASGLIVLAVEPGGPAEHAGLLLGDVLIRVGERVLERVEDLQGYCETAAIGTQAAFTIIRGGERQTAALTLGERPRGEN